MTTISDGIIGLLPHQAWPALNILACLVISSALIWLLLRCFDPDDEKHASRASTILFRTALFVSFISALSNVHDDAIAIWNGVASHKAVTEVVLNVGVALMFSWSAYYHSYILGIAVNKE